MFKFGPLLILAYLIYECQCRASTNISTFFRRDYTLYSEVGAFYKLHKNPKPWNEARKFCILEGAALAVPETADEAEVYKKVLDAGSVTVALLGIQAFSKGLFTALDGTSIDEIYHNWGPGEPNDVNNNEDCVVTNNKAELNDVVCEHRFPFICEKSQAAVKWNEDCQVADLEYHRIVGMDHCYKVHVKQKNWPDAYAACAAEQSYLAILNSKKESDALKKLFDSESRGKTNGRSEVIHLGFHDRYKEGEFTTIQGMSLAEAGYDQWGTGQPDHPGKETCGSMFFNGKLNDVDCGERSYFICELEDNSALSLRTSG